MARRVKKIAHTATMSSGCLSAAVALLVLVPTLSADLANIGLTSRFVDVVLQNVAMGRVYDLGRMQSQTFSITNQGQTPLSVQVEKEIPGEPYLKPGYQPIPDTGWITVTPDHFKLKPGKTLVGRVTLRVPPDANWKGRHFQAALWTHSAEGPMAVGVRSYVSFSVETDKPQVQPAPKTAELKMVINPGPKIDVTAGKDLQIGSLSVRNEGDRAVKVELRSVRPQWLSIQDALPTPNPDFVKLSKTSIEIPAKGSVDVPLLSDIPAGSAHIGKTYAFSLRVDDFVNKQSFFSDLYLKVAR